jgi:hypothetical protein
MMGVDELLLAWQCSGTRTCDRTAVIVARGLDLKAQERIMIEPRSRSFAAIGRKRLRR